MTHDAEPWLIESTILIELPFHRHPSLNAADLATALLVPMLDGGTAADGCDSDASAAYEAGRLTYRYRPAELLFVTEESWVDDWIHDFVTPRARELLRDSRFAALRCALETMLMRSPELSATHVREVLAAVDDAVESHNPE